MASKCGHPLHAGVAPHADVVLRVPVGANELVDVFREQEIAHLTFCLDSVERFQLVCVPEPNRSVLGAAATREETLLMRGPSDGLNGRLVLVEDNLRLVVVVRTPDHQLVVIAARRQLLAVETPFQAAHLLFVSLKLGFIVFARAQVTMHNASISAPGAQKL